MKNLIAITLVALAFGACSATPAPVVQPTPQIVYVTPAPTVEPTPAPTVRPTPEPTQDASYADFLIHSMAATTEGSGYMQDVSDAAENLDMYALNRALQDLLDWSVRESIYADNVVVPSCGQPMVDSYNEIVTNYGLAAISFQQWLEDFDDTSYELGANFMDLASKGIDNMPSGLCQASMDQTS